MVFEDRERERSNLKPRFHAHTISDTVHQRLCLLTLFVVIKKQTNYAANLDHIINFEDYLYKDAFFFLELGSIGLC